MSKPANIPIFVPHLGCPHDCVFCNQKKITGQGHEINKAEVIREIEACLKTMKGKRYPIEVAFFGGSFTGIDEKKQNQYLEIARRYLHDGHIHGIRLSTRPDYISEEIVERLIEYGVTTIELGVQSLDESVLRASNRGHSLLDVHRAVGIIKALGRREGTHLKLGLQMMIGLPEDSIDKAKHTAHEIISLKPDFVRIYPTVVIKDTELEALYESGHYRAMTVDVATDWLSELMPIFTSSGVPIIRVGLQPTDALTNGGDMIAGAYHPSMGQLAQAKIIRKHLVNRIEKSLKKLPVIKGRRVTVRLSANSRDWTPFRGEKACNFEFLKTSFPDLDFEFAINDALKRGMADVEICVDSKTYKESMELSDL